MFPKLGSFGFGDSSNFGTSTAFTQNFGAPTAFNTQNTSTSGLFGSSTTTTSGGLFGQPATFGQQSSGFSFNNTPSTSGGLFGQQPASSLFSQPASNAFSAKTPISSFGSFGTNSSNTNLFSRNQPSVAIFGQSGNMFGSSTTCGTSTKFHAPVGQDTMVKGGITNNISTRHQCISAMKEYEDKSLEELRMEDYQAGRKSKQQQPLAQPQPQQPTSSSLFGISTSQPATGFGFSQNKPTTTTGFGNARGNTNLFNQNRAPLTSSGLFGQPTKPLFANPTDTANSSFSFNLNQNTGNTLFGQNQQQNKTLFGSTSQPSNNLFNTTTNAPTFGSGTTGFTNQGGSSLFGNKQMPFSTATTNTSFQFQNSGNNLFNKPTTVTPFAFGTNTSTGVFGASTGNNLFNNKPFGTTNTLNQNTSSFNFANSGQNIFGNQPKSYGFNMSGTGSGFATNLGSGSGFSLGGNTSTLGSHTMSLSGPTTDPGNLQQHLKLLTHNPYGDSSLFMNLNDSKIRTEDVLKPTNPTAQKAVLSSQYKIGTRPLARAKPKSLIPLISKKKMQIFDGLDDDDEFGYNGQDFTLKRNIKKLVVKSLSTSAKPSIISNSIKPNNGLSNNSKTITRIEKVTMNKDDENNISDGSPLCYTELNEKENDAIDSNQSNIQEIPANNETEYEYSNIPIHPANIVLTRPGYYTVPSWNELSEFTDENDDCIVEDLTIGREGYGSVFFPGLTNIAGMNFDEIIHFRKKEVTVYPDDVGKPEVGQGLNKRAEITLDCVWPVDKTTKTIISNPEKLKLMKYEEKLENATINLGGEFLDYRPETGSWVFEVKHFSKYGLKDEDTEDYPPQDISKSVKETNQRNLLVQKQKMSPNAGNLNMPQAFTKPDMLETSMLESNLSTNSKVPSVNGLNVEDDAEMSDLVGIEYPQKGFQMETMETAEPIQSFSSSLVVESGISSSNMQMMKASFFGYSENNVKSDLPEMPPMTSFEKGANQIPHLKKKDHLKIQSHRTRDTSPGLSRSKKDVLQVIGLSSKSTQPSVVGMNFRRCNLCASNSIFSGIKSSMEISFSRNYSFRVGWGPNWTFVHPGPAVCETNAASKEINYSILSQKTVPPSNWAVSIEKLNVSSYLTNTDSSVKEQQTWMLENQLSHSVTEKSKINPYFRPKDGIEALCKYAEGAAHEDQHMTSHPDYNQIHHMKICWDLCVALWGKPVELGKGASTLSVYEYQQARKQAFSRWIAETESQVITDEILQNSLKVDGNLLSITSYLSGRQIQDACMLAIKNGNKALALLIAQASCSSRAYRNYMMQQLPKFSLLDPGTISVERLKIYGLLAGKMFFNVGGQDINVCEHMDWKRALGLHLWYGCSQESVIVEVLKKYDDAQTGSTSFGKYARPPVPPYLENNNNNNSDINCDTVKAYDTCYHLLQLYANKAYQLEQTLSPAATTANHLDYRLSWHLSQVLQSLQYRHLTKYQKECINHRFAAQLESLDLWEWAIFVLAHIEDDRRREAAIKETLMRHVSLSEDASYLEREDFIVDRLCVPEQWLHYAKAIKAQYENDYKQVAWHMINAGHYNDAHKVIMKHIASQAIIDDDFHHLKKLLTPLSSPEQSAKIQNWDSEGSVFLGYIYLCEVLAQFKTIKIDLPRLKMMYTALLKLCSSLRSLPCNNAKERLCVSEMSKNAANILRTFSMFLHLDDSELKITNLLAARIENLEIPDESMEQEVNKLIL
ncbi:nuclear pore complex protein Nup98-Nup96-like isoform X2 [Argonauta hians]